LRVAYLTAQYPKTSHSFIRREIAALERLGIQVERYSVRRVDEPLVDPDDIAERGRTHVILESGPFGLVALTGLLALRRPVRWLRALRSAASMGWRSERGLLVYLIYFFEACALVPALERQGVEHLHAHFSQNGTTIARLARMLGGPTYSFTVHGPHELNVAPLLSLKGKVADAKFVAAISRYARAQVMYFSATSDWPKIAIVHCGLDRIHLAREPEPLPQAPRLVCVARFDPEKGHLVLLEALGRLAREGIAFELDLIGDGLMRPAIEQACARLGIAQRVKLSGWLGSAEVHEHLVASRIFVSTSFMEGARPAGGGHLPGGHSRTGRARGERLARARFGRGRAGARAARGAHGAAGGAAAHGRERTRARARGTRRRHRGAQAGRALPRVARAGLNAQATVSRVRLHQSSSTNTLHSRV
jgi:glycosyltransferase involved in cell wall biosynthesis